VRDVPPPTPAPGEALIRVRLAGICGTDLALLRGYYPYAGIPGHEFVGEVIEAHDDSTWLGRRVVGEINNPCNACPTCEAGRPTHCPTRTVLGIQNRNGAHAELLTLPLANLHAVPDELSDEQAVFTEPLAAALEILEQIRIQTTDRVLLIGAGRLGQLIAQILGSTGCELQVIAKHANQRALLRLHQIPLLDQHKLTDAGHDIVVEATGSPEGFTLARRAVRPRGTIVLKSTYPDRPSIDLSTVVVDELTIIGSRCGPFASALKALRNHTVDVTNLVEAEYPLDEALSAFAHAPRHAALKVLVRPHT